MQKLCHTYSKLQRYFPGRAISVVVDLRALCRLRGHYDARHQVLVQELGLKYLGLDPLVAVVVISTSVDLRNPYVLSIING